MQVHNLKDDRVNVMYEHTSVNLLLRSSALPVHLCKAVNFTTLIFVKRRNSCGLKLSKLPHPLILELCSKCMYLKKKSAEMRLWSLF